MKKRFCSLFLCFVLIAGSLSGCAGNELSKQPVEVTLQVKEEKPTFDEFLEARFLEDITSSAVTFIQYVENADNFGIKEYEHTIGELAPEAYQESIRNCERYLEELVSYDYNALTKEQKVDYEYYKILLENTIDAKELYYYNEPLSTIDGDQIVVPALTALHATRFFESMKANGTKDIAVFDEYFEIYAMIEEYFKQVAQFEIEKSDLGLFMSEKRAKQVLNYCSQVVSEKAAAVGSGFLECVEETDWLTKEEKDYLVKKNEDLVKEHIVPAYQAVSDAMTVCMTKDNIGKGLADTENGKLFYELLLKEKTTSNLLPLEAAALLEDYLGKWEAERNQILENNPDIYNDVIEATSVYQSPDKVVSMLNSQMKMDFPALSISWETKDMPKSMNSFAAGLFYPPAFDAKQKSEVVYIGTTLSQGSYDYISTIAHEGVPGHLYHYSYIKQLPISNYRKLLAFNQGVGYLEGWTTYIEEFAGRYAGVSDEGSRIVQLDKLIQDGMIQRLDIGINYEGWTQEEVGTFLRKYPSYILMSNYLQEYVINSPCLLSSYVLGYIMLMEIKEDLTRLAGGKLSDYEFHKLYLQIGPATYDILREQLGINEE